MGSKLLLAIGLLSPAIFAQPAFTVVESSIPEMRAALEHHKVTSREIVTQYLVRIATYEDKLHAAITVNPNALEEADALDRERAQGRVRGPLHGIPVALKDNVMTTRLPTTGGALAFDGFVPPYEATLVKNLRDAGAIIIAKTGMTELANWVAGAPTPMPGELQRGRRLRHESLRSAARSARRHLRRAAGAADRRIELGHRHRGEFLGGQRRHRNLGIDSQPVEPEHARRHQADGRAHQPLRRDSDHRRSGHARADGEERDRRGDCSGALEGAAPDPNDPATSKCTPPPGRDYTRFLSADGLKGARIGIPRAFYYDRVTPPGSNRPRGGLNAEQAKAMAEAIDVLKKQGAIIVDPADIPSIVTKDPAANLLLWNTCSGASDSKGRDADCSVVLKYGMKRDFNKWLESLGPSAPVKTLTELREWNITHTKSGAIRFGQSNLDISDEMDVRADRARYEADRARDIALSATHGIDEVMKANNLDALLFPGPSGAAIAAKPGYPTVIVPFAMVPNAPMPPFPDGFNAKPSPFGVSFTGMACSEPRLIELAYSFEQATKRRVPPPSAP